MSNPKDQKITIGTWAKITGLAPGEEEVFEFVSESEADPLENKIPSTSPLAKVLEGATAGDRIPFDPPSGRVELTVLEVGQL
ncbi:MAG: GreA/GreB family elongation factor [Pirellulales bacterium]|nr:GreA/GreB family elongation factor [Pirellulales bacterium]